MTLLLPRYVNSKRLKNGKLGFFFNPPTKFRKAGCTVKHEPLGTDYVVACGAEGKGGRAAALNALLDEWHDSVRGLPITNDRAPVFSTTRWLFQEYRRTKSYTEKVSPRSRPDYERTMQIIENITTKRGDKLGDHKIKSISPRAADKIYEIILAGPNGERPRQAEKAVALCRRAWRVVHRLHPAEFNRDVPNPWDGVTRKRRTKRIKPAVTRELVYAFAWGCIGNGYPEPAAAAVICFEWLQRPENVLAGYLRWTDYRSKEWPNAIKIEHHKTGAVVWHPLQDEDGTLFYPEAEAVLAKLPRRGVPMILRKLRGDTCKPYSFSGFQKIVHTMRDKLGLPPAFTLDACRHGGMTELEEAELTDGQGRALSAHKSQQAYEGYAKRTMERALSATRKRHAHRLANAQSTSVQNGDQKGVQNEISDGKTTAAK